MAAGRADVRQLLLQVDANVELARRALDGLDRDIGRNTQSIDTSLGRIDASMKRVIGAAAGFIGIQGVASLGRQFLSLADESKQMQAQLQLATAEFGSLGQAQKDAAQIAGETRNGLSETTSLYANFLRASASLGKTQDEAARATETFSKALKLGGAGAAESASATLQFGQALASGALRGDEFNSIAEASPRILKLLADSLGVSTGALRKMAEDGKLTADVLYTALTDRKFTEAIDNEFRQLPVTFDEAMVQVSNAAITTFGAFDRGGEFSTMIANFVTDGAKGFADLESAALTAGRNIRAEYAGFAEIWGPYYEAGIEILDKLEKRGIQVGRVIAMAINPLGAAAEYFPGRQDAENASRSASIGNEAAAAQRARRIAELNTGVTRQDMFGRTLPGQTPTSPTATPTSTPDASKKRKRGKSGPTLADQFSALEGRLDPEARAGKEYRETLALIDSAEKAGIKATTSFDDLRRAAGKDLMKDLGIKEMPILILQTAENMDLLAGQISELPEIIPPEEMQRLLEFQEVFTRDLAAGIADAIVYGDSLGDVLANSFKRAAAALVESGLMELINPGGSGGSLFRGFLSGSSSLFSGLGFANGGTPPVGKISVVGERGPELFIPKVPGVVVPNHALMGGWGGGGTQLVTVQIDKSALFDTHVRVAAAPLAAAAAARGAAGGASMAEQRLNRRAMQTLR